MRGSYLTPEGLEKLKAEYKELVEGKKPAVQKRVERARSLGDLTENSAYQQAKKEQAFVEGRIRELEHLFENAQVVEEKKEGEVGIGSKVKVKVNGQEEEYILVGEAEADAASGRISHLSPLGQALLGKRLGDRVRVEAPDGGFNYEILGLG